MDTIYDSSGDVIGFVQRDAEKSTAYGGRGDFLGWTDGQNVYAHDGRLVARGQNALGMLFESSED
jgi:hypothetical protein